jgi:hypothetical protein
MKYAVRFVFLDCVFVIEQIGTNQTNSKAQRVPLRTFGAGGEGNGLGRGEYAILGAKPNTI